MGNRNRTRTKEKEKKNKFDKDRLPLVEGKLPKQELTTKDIKALNYQFTKILAQGSINQEDLDVLEALLKCGVNVDWNWEGDVWKTTWLMVASRNGLLEICKLLIKYGADVNLQDYRGNTALAQAAKNWHYICRFLIENGADVNIQNREGYTALTIAACNGNIDVCELLIENGANVNIQDKDGWTALIETANTRYWNICKLLIEKGADIQPVIKKDIRTVIRWMDWEELREAIEKHTEIGRMVVAANNCVPESTYEAFVNL